MYLIIAEMEQFFLCGSYLKVTFPGFTPRFLYLADFVRFPLPDAGLRPFGVGVPRIAIDLYFISVHHRLLVKY
jgi:hypothetical protein